MGAFANLLGSSAGSFITGIVNGALSVVGGGLNLAGVKRSGELTLDALELQGELQQQSYEQQQALLDDMQQADQEKAAQTTANLIKVFAVVIIGIVVLISVKAIIKKPA